MFFVQNEWATAGSDRLGVSLENCITRLAGADRQILRFDGQSSAGPETHEIEGIRQRKRLIKIIDAPDQPSFAVSPGTKILNV